MALHLQGWQILPLVFHARTAQPLLVAFIPFHHCCHTFQSLPTPKTKAKVTLIALVLNSPDGI
jgi:hypothetical protein